MKTDMEVDQRSIMDTLKKLSRWDINYRNEVKRMIKRNAGQVRKKAMGLVPVDEGNLKSSIRVKMISDYSGTVYPRGRKGSHRHLIEYGTVKMKARPYMKPAEDAVKGDFMRDGKELANKLGNQTI